jgi:hypothetical protein
MYAHLGILYFGQFNPFHCSPLLLPFLPSLFNSFQYMSLYPLKKRKKMWYLYTMEFYSATKRNEILSFAGKWMELENIILSKVSQI